jgi:chromosomal replication initiation ATPase DnaA
MADAIDVLEKVVSDLQEDSSGYRSVFIYGPAGSGKTHLLSIYQNRLQEMGIQVSSFNAKNLVTSDAVSAFVSTVEQYKQSSGVVFIEGESLTALGTDSLAAHVNSRLLGGYAVKVCQPMESELKPLVLALLERRGLRLGENSIDQLIKKLPANAMTFSNIIQGIDEVSLGQLRRINKGVIADALKLADHF